MSDGTPLNIVVEIDDRRPGKPLAQDGSRNARIEITLPTWEGSDGPSLDGPGWEDAVATLVRNCSASIAVMVPERDDDERLAKLAKSVAELRGAFETHSGAVGQDLRDLDRTVDAAHQRLDAAGAPDMETIERQEAEDAERALASEAIGDKLDALRYGIGGTQRVERIVDPGQAQWKRARYVAIDGKRQYADMRIRDIVTPSPKSDAVLVVHEDTGNTAWLTAEEAQARVDAGILEPDPEATDG